MADKQENISPEEKLLKVIQAGGAKPGDSSPERKVVAVNPAGAVSAEPAKADKTVLPSSALPPRVAFVPSIPPPIIAKPAETVGSAAQTVPVSEKQQAAKPAMSKVEGPAPTVVSPPAQRSVEEPVSSSVPKSTPAVSPARAPAAEPKQPVQTVSAPVSKPEQTAKAPSSPPAPVSASKPVVSPPAQRSAEAPASSSAPKSASAVPPARAPAVEPKQPVQAVSAPVSKPEQTAKAPSPAPGPAKTVSPATPAVQSAPVPAATAKPAVPKTPEPAKAVKKEDAAPALPKLKTPVKAPGSVPADTQASSVSEQSAQAKGKTEKPVAEKNEPEIEMAGEPALMFPVKKRSEETFILRTVNKALAAGVVLLIGLAVVEIFASVRMDAGGHGATGGVKNPELGTNNSVSAVSIEEAVSLWAKSPWDNGDEAPAPEKKTNTVNKAWLGYVNENLKLIGISVKDPPDQSDAILMDKKEKRTIFLRKGQSTPIQGASIKLEAIEAEHVRLTDGQDGIDIK